MAAPSSSRDLLLWRLWVPGSDPGHTRQCPMILYLVGVVNPVLSILTNWVGALPHRVMWPILWSCLERSYGSCDGSVPPVLRGHQNLLVWTALAEHPPVADGGSPSPRFSRPASTGTHFGGLPMNFG